MALVGPKGLKAQAAHFEVISVFVQIYNTKIESHGSADNQ